MLPGTCITCWHCSGWLKQLLDSLCQGLTLPHSETGMGGGRGRRGNGYCAMSAGLFGSEGRPEPIDIYPTSSHKDSPTHTSGLLHWDAWPVGGQRCCQVILWRHAWGAGISDASHVVQTQGEGPGDSSLFWFSFSIGWPPQLQHVGPSGHDHDLRVVEELCLQTVCEIIPIGRNMLINGYLQDLITAPTEHWFHMYTVAVLLCGFYYQITICITVLFQLSVIRYM